jgi:hypothetical protein
MIAIMTTCGFFLGLASIALPSLPADIVDYDVWRNRQERAAIFFSFQALVTKLNQDIDGIRRLAMRVARAQAGAGMALPTRATRPRHPRPAHRGPRRLTLSRM